VLAAIKGRFLFLFLATFDERTCEFFDSHRCDGSLCFSFCQGKTHCLPTIWTNIQNKGILPKHMKGGDFSDGWLNQATIKRLKIRGMSPVAVGGRLSLQLSTVRGT